MNIYAGNLLRSIVCSSYTSASTTDYIRLFNTVRLKRVEARGISSAVNKITTFTLIWNNDSNREITASGNTESPYYLRSTPPLGNIRFWQLTDSTVLFRLTTDADFGEGQLDVFFDVVYFDSLSPHPWTGPSTTNGQALMTNALDCTTDGSTYNATHYWLPVGRTLVA